MTVRRYTWRPDVADFRDHHYTLRTSPIPSYVDRIGLGNNIEDQGNLGSCTGNASTSAAEIVCKLNFPLSRLMAYYQGRLIEGTVNQDAGCMIRDVIKGISKFGVCKESLYPYDIRRYRTRPTAKAYKDALTLLPKIGSYQRITSLQGVKNALANGTPVVFGFSVPEYFQSEDVSLNGWVRFPLITDKMIGGHAVVAVGYDDRAPTPFIWVRNSWGADWGIQGYFKMDQKWFSDPARLVDDMWVMTPAP